MNNETELSERIGVDTAPAPAQTNGAQIYHGRIADLLDDVTVGAQPVATAEETLDELFAGQIVPPAPAPPARGSEPPAAAPPVASQLSQPPAPVAAPPSPPALPAGLGEPSGLPAAAPAVASQVSQPPSAPPVMPAASASQPSTLDAAAPPAPPTVLSAPAPDESSALPAAAPPLLAAGLASAVTPPPVAPASELAAPPAADSAAAMFPTWVPPWDESQRQTPPPATSAPLTASPQGAEAAGAPAERSIFAPLAAGAVAAARPVESHPAAPPSDLPPFLAGATIPARFAPTPPASGDAALDQPAPAVTVAPGEAAPGVDAPAEAPLTEAPPTPGAGLVSIRGRMDGLAIEVGAGPWPEITAALAARLDQSASFFRNANVALELGPRALAEDELNVIATLLHKHGMALALVRTGAERTFQSALALGLTVTLEGADGAAMAEAAAATTNVNTAGFFVYRGYLRSGNRLRRQEHVLVIGDVNPGAEVISDGDVLVWGRLRGIVHAGAAGNVRSIVAALDMEPTQLRIADVMTTSPDPQPGQPGKWFWQRSAHKRAEVARLVHKAITFEEWDAGRPGGLVSLRRSG